MRIVKDPFTGDLLLSLNDFERSQIKDKGLIRISMKDNFFGSLKVLWEDISSILTQEIKIIQNTKGEKKEMKTYLINEEQRQEVLKYMWTRPYGEVHRLMEIILKLQENKNEPEQKSEKKKV